MIKVLLLFFILTNKFYRYNLDKEPADYGLVVGQYEKGKEAYLGLGVFSNSAYQFNRLSLDPPGIQLFNVAGKGSFSNDSSKIWYLYNNKNHEYTWVDSKNGEVPSFAIEVGEEESGYTLLAGRIVKDNGLILIGVVVPFMGVMYYADEEGYSRSTNVGYQVLTCRSRIKDEVKVMAPKFNENLAPNVDVGCIHNWLPYVNDNAPEKKGISASKNDCCNSAFVAKAKDKGVFIPGRIQTVGCRGFYSTSGGKDLFLPNGSFYLADNPEYTYSWQIFDGKNVPENGVFVRNDVGLFAFPIGRINVDGQVQIGKVAYPVLSVANGDGGEAYFYDFEILVCDPWPKFKCGHEWKIFNKNKGQLFGGFEVETNQKNLQIFIGKNKENVGKIVMSLNSVGLYYFDESTLNEVFDDKNAEYLVKNQNFTYKWQPSKTGQKLENALELQEAGQWPIFIGMTKINENIFIGKVRYGEDFYFIDLNGKEKSTSSFNILTCFSPSK